MTEEVNHEKQVQDAINGLIQLSNNKEIFNLWYEITFLRMLINHILTHNHSIAQCIDNDAIENARLMAQIEVQSKFPGSEHLFFNQKKQENT